MDTQQVDEKAVFNIARRIADASARDDYLAQACGDDYTAIQRVRELLRIYEQEQSFLESPAAELAATSDTWAICERPGTVIGPYKLLQQIGEGGMGVVFMAEQTEPIQRTVALKIIKPGMDTRQVIARFEAERQALALMDHPNIARVVDAGTTDTGRPYFVMDLVKGVPITKYCDEKHLSLRERLELLLPVCQAVQHAHQKGIIHRDIKPTNVLVAEYDNHAVPKVIDFGVAKATAQKLTEQTMFTEFGQVIGTMEYMSPEQAKLNQLDIDTRSDIYSLGVLLYELLTSSTPFEQKRFRQAAFDEVLRIIREEEPPKPSTKLSSSDTLPSIAANRHSEPARLSREVRGDLDWIAMKALEKDRNHRYETANGLALDIERYLHDEPVLACPPSAGYRLRKFARKHRASLGVATSFAILLMIATVISTWQAVRATHAEEQAREHERQAVAERDEKEQARRGEALERARAEANAAAAKRQESEARQQANIARAVKDFLNNEILLQASVSFQSGNLPPDPDLKVRDALDTAANRIPGRFPKQPLVEAAIRHTIGDAYRHLREPTKAEQHLEAALQLRRQTLGEQHVETLATLAELARVHLGQKQYARAEKGLLQALEGQRQVLGAQHEETLFTMTYLAMLYQEERQYAKAEALFVPVLEGHRAVLGAQSAGTFLTQKRLADLYAAMRQYAKAEPLYLQVLEWQRKLVGEQHTQTLDTISSLGALYLDQGLYAKAEPLLRESLEGNRKTRGAHAPTTLTSLRRLATLYADQHEHAKAETLYHEALATQRKIHGEENAGVATTMVQLGGLLQLQGKSTEAESLYREALALQRKLHGSEHPDVATTLYWLAGVVRSQGNRTEAEERYREALAIRRKALGAEHPDVAQVLINLSGLLQSEARHAEAEPLVRECLSIRRQAFPEGDWRIATAKSLLGATLSGQGKHAEAEPLLLAAWDELQAKPPPPSQAARTRENLDRIVKLYDDWGKSNEADKWRATLPAETEEQMKTGNETKQK